MTSAIYLLAISVTLVISSPYHFVLGTNNGVNGTSTYNFGYDTRDHPGGGGTGGGTDTGPRLMREETRLPDGTVIGRYGYTDPFGVFRQVKYVAGSTGYYAYEDVTGGSGGSTSLPLFFKATARQRDLGLASGIDLSAKFNPPLYHPEAHLAESPSTPSTFSSSSPPPTPTTTTSTLSPWEISFKKLLIPSNKPVNDGQLSDHHHHHHFHPNHQYPSDNSRLSALSSSSSPTSTQPFQFSSSSSTRKQSRLIHPLSPPPPPQGQNGVDQLTPNKDKESFKSLSTSSSGLIVSVDGQSRYNQRPPKTAFQFDYDQAALAKKQLIPPQSSADSYDDNYKSPPPTIKSNSNDDDGDLKELESYRIQSDLNIRPSSLSRRRSPTLTILSSPPSTRTTHQQYNKVSVLPTSTPPPKPTPTTETIVTAKTESATSEPKTLRNQVNSGSSNRSVIAENDGLPRPEELSSNRFNHHEEINHNLNDTHLPKISISREPVLEESIGSDDLGETESVRVTSSSSSSIVSSSSSSDVIDSFNPDSGIKPLSTFSSSSSSSSSPPSLAPLPIVPSDIARYRMATIPEVEILSTYGTRLSNPIDGQPESLGYYDSRLLRGLNYDDTGLEPQPVYKPIIDTSTLTSMTTTTTTSSVDDNIDLIKLNETESVKPDLFVNPLVGSISVSTQSTIKDEGGFEEEGGKDNEKIDSKSFDENPIESILNLPDQSLTITIKPDDDDEMVTTSLPVILKSSELPSTINQSNNSYSLLTDQRLKVDDRNVEVTPNLTHKQVINNRLITGLTRVSQSVTLSLRTEGTTTTTTTTTPPSTLPSITIDKSTVSGLDEVTTEIMGLPEIITDDELTKSSTPTQSTTILSSSSSSSPTTSLPPSTTTTISSSIENQDATTVKSDLNDEITTQFSSIPMISETELNQTIGASSESTDIPTTTEEPSTTIKDNLEIDEQLSRVIPTEASPLSVELTSKSNWYQSTNNDVRSSSAPLSVPPSTAAIDYENISEELKKLPNDAVSNGIDNQPVITLTQNDNQGNKVKDDDEKWTEERILTKANSSRDEPHRIETRLEIPNDSSKPMKKIVKIWYKRGRFFYSDSPSKPKLDQNVDGKIADNGNYTNQSEKLPRTKIIRIPRGHRPERLGYRKGVFLNKIPFTTTPTTVNPITIKDSTSTISSTYLTQSTQSPSSSSSPSTITPEPTINISSTLLTTTTTTTSSTDQTLSESPTQLIMTTTTLSTSPPTPTVTIPVTILPDETESIKIITSTLPPTTTTIKLTNPSLPITTNTINSEITTSSTPSTVTTIKEMTETPEGFISTLSTIQSTTTSLPSSSTPSSISSSTSTVSPTIDAMIKPSALYVPPIASLLRSLVNNQALINTRLHSQLGLSSPPISPVIKINSQESSSSLINSNLYVPPIPYINSETQFESPSPSFPDNKPLISTNHNLPITRSIGIINNEKQSPYHLPLTYFH